MRDRADQRTDLGADQQTLQPFLLLDPLVVDDLVAAEVEICLGSHVLYSLDPRRPGGSAGVRPSANSATDVDVGLVDERRPGQAWPAAADELPLFRYSHSESMAR